MGDEHTCDFEKIKVAAASVSKVNYYDSKYDTKIKRDASHFGLGATLERKRI